jgi:hypothetical protein
MEINNVTTREEIDQLKIALDHEFSELEKIRVALSIPKNLEIFDVKSVPAGMHEEYQSYFQRHTECVQAMIGCGALIEKWELLNKHITDS